MSLVEAAGRGMALLSSPSFGGREGGKRSDNLTMSRDTKLRGWLFIVFSRVNSHRVCVMLDLVAFYDDVIFFQLPSVN